ncbi:34769_t:CDS:2 [Gigaspora margarita]|uniref:34769_t:CDS:1 n=1 Tax=Gigaspora margarita TaxID=4874 RepID=A0ABN7UNW8_GIGMA|nr:34769_t:CDS:2 [Gigaspora margarita]
MTTMQDRKSMLTQTIDKIITQKIGEADCNIKLVQAINKLLIQEIGKGFKTYIEKLDQDYDSESNSELEEALKEAITICKTTVKNPITTNNVHKCDDKLMNTNISLTIQA